MQRLLTVHSIVRTLFIGELSWKRVIRSLLLIPIAVYLGLVMIAWLFPNKVIFRPPPASYSDDASIIKLKTSDGDLISAKFYENDAAIFTILFSHGNGEDIGQIEPFLIKLRDGGFSVFAYDYRGYGTSAGYSTEEHAYADINAAYRYLLEVRKIPPHRIILHGRSLGGGVAVDLATRELVAGLILESTFTSAARVLSRIRLIPFDRFESIDKLREVGCPILVMHGRKDWTIPFHHGETLFEAANEPKGYLWIDSAGHNDLFIRAGRSYVDAIRSFAGDIAITAFEK